jgi:hypothetical protein
VSKEEKKRKRCGWRNRRGGQAMHFPTKHWTYRV